MACLKIDGRRLRPRHEARLEKHAIAEQVETDAELALLKDMGVDFVQGYLLHRPVPLLVD